LREAILRGDIAPGLLTSQVELARDFEVGRTPLREALRMLQHEGLVVLQPNRRVRIAALTLSDAEELYLTRVALETVAVRITVPTFGPEDIAELEGIMAQMEHLAKAGAGQPAVHHAFHARFVAGAGERPARLISQLSDHSERYRRAYGASVPNHWPKRQLEHREILDAAALGDADAVADAIARHYLRTATIVAAALDPSATLDRLNATVNVVAPGASLKLQGLN
jgi:DNA-binding GntR family transcriptional regulator